MRDIASPNVPAAFSVPFGLMEDAFRRLSSLVREVPQAELEYQGPSGDLNSIATLLAHLARVDLDYLHAIKGQPVPQELDHTYGPYETENQSLPVVTGSTAAELLERYEFVLSMVREYLQTQTDADAKRSVQVAWWPQPATVRFVLWHMASHSMFHQGQIARLKQWYSSRAS